MRIRDCAEDFICEARLLKRSENTVAAYRKRLKYFIRFCEDECGIGEIEGVSPRNRYVKSRDRAILTFLFDSGIRASELCGITESDIMEDYILIHGKGAKERVVPISVPMRKTMGKYRSERERYFRDGRFKLDDRLFLTCRGGKMSEKTLWAVFEKLSKGGIFEGVRSSPHTARHYYSVKMLTSQGASTYEIQRLLGHSNLATTSTYLASLTNEELIANNKGKSVLMGI